MSKEIEQAAEKWINDTGTFQLGENVCKIATAAFIAGASSQPSPRLREVIEKMNGIAKMLNPNDPYHDGMLNGIEQYEAALKSLTDEPEYQILDNENNWVTIDKDWYDRAKETHRRIITKSQPTDEPDAGYSGWISVEDRLPDETVMCLVYGGYYKDKIQTEIFHKQRKFRIGITHWQPLPKPPIKQTPAKDEEQD